MHLVPAGAPLAPEMACMSDDLSESARAIRVFSDAMAAVGASYIKAAARPPGPGDGEQEQGAAEDGTQQRNDPSEQGG